MARADRPAAEIVPTPEAPTGRIALDATEPRAFCNAHLSAKQIQRHGKVEGDAKMLLAAAITQMNLSARAYDRILMVALPSADLAETDRIAQIAKAVQYPAFDRKIRE
jgi:magnesium chelatase family protein